MKSIHSDAEGSAGQVSTVGTLLYLLLGPIVWALHFTTTYGVQSFICALTTTGRSGGNSAIIIAIIWAATLLALAVLAFAISQPAAASRFFGIAAVADGPRKSFHAISRLLSSISVFAIVAVAVTSLIVPECGSAR